MSAAVIVLATIVLGQAAADAEPKEKPFWLDTAKAHIAACEVFPAGDAKQPFKLHPQPIFHHIQSTRGNSVGSVFLFVGDGGRPAAVGDVFFFRRGKQHQMYNEWHSLAAVPLNVKWGDVMLMQAGEAGVKWQPIPDSPRPAEGKQARERQLRQLAHRFTAHLINKDQDKFELRLLTTPLYQYHADEKATDKAGYLGGGLFAFCQETDPEIFLLIEAISTADGPQWNYAAAEFSNLSLFLQLDDKEAWKADPPGFSSLGPHFGGMLKLVDLPAPPAAGASPVKP